MKPKQVLLAQAAGRLVDRLVKPLCRDASGVAQSQSTLDARGEAACPSGTALEFAPVRDLHVGVLTSSLGNHGNTGADAVCTDDANHVSSDHARLTGRGIGSAPIENAKFLAYASPGTSAAYTDIDALEASLAALVLGAGDTGCASKTSSRACTSSSPRPIPGKTSPSSRTSPSTTV